MSKLSTWIGPTGTGVRALARGLLGDRRGNVGAMVALLIVPLIGVMALAGEVSSWFFLQRAAQNAADSAVLAAANNGGTTYGQEAQSVAASYAFTVACGTDAGVCSYGPPDGNGQLCPGTTDNYSCYKVKITQQVPLYLVGVVGYGGTGGGKQAIVASAMAGLTNSPVSDCILSLATSGIAYNVNGAGGASIDLNQCDVQANGGAKCDGTNASANVEMYFVSGNNAKCSPPDPAYPSGGSQMVCDPYGGITPTGYTGTPCTAIYPRTNIPSHSCSGSNPYPQEPVKKNDPALPSSNTPSNTNPPAWSATTFFCGDVQLSGDLTIPSGTSLIVIENGQLDLNNKTMQGAGVTIIFTGTNGGGYSHTPPANGTLDISAPTTGDWHGVAIYQDPALTSGVDWASNGNSLNWDITGLIYMPNSNIAFKGTINKATGGVNCFTMVNATTLLSGTVKINENQSQCDLAGLNTLPTSNLPRAVLVQ
jgi:Flp pilus assembly protein TadG